MAREVGDLWPQASGSASLGAEMTNDEFTSEIRPFAHMHMMSGIFHSLGQSGIIRFNLANDLSYTGNAAGIPSALELSCDGGKTFPLRLGAYKQGTSTITPAASISSPFGINLNIETSGLLTVIGRANISFIQENVVGSIDISSNGAINALAGSDIFFTATKSLNFESNNGPTIFQTLGSEVDNVIKIDGLSVLLPKSSGTATIGYRHPNEFRPFASIHQNSGVFHAPYGGSGIIRFTQQRSIVDNIQSNALEISPNGGKDYVIRIGGDSAYGLVEANGNKTLLVRGSGINIVSIGNINIAARFKSALGEFGSINFHAFDIFRIKSNENNEIISDKKTIIAPNGTDAQLNISGVYIRPKTNPDIGDVYMMSHSVISGIIKTTTRAKASAQALGHGTLVIDTGSGIINLSVGSGLAQWANVGTQTLTTVAQNVNLNVALESSDLNYGLGTGLSSGVITIFSPGLYKLSYKIAIEKNIGTIPQTCEVDATLNGAQILGSVTNTFHFNNTTAAENSASVVILFNAQPRDTIAIRAFSTSAGSNNCRIKNRGCLAVLEKIGPTRRTF